MAIFSYHKDPYPIFFFASQKERVEKLKDIYIYIYIYCLKVGIQTGLILVPAGTNQSTGNHLKANINFRGSVVNIIISIFSIFFLPAEK